MPPKNNGIMSTRWRKVILDLWTHKARTLLVVAAIAVGVFAMGLVAGGQSILLRELQRGYQASAAASAILYTQPFDDALVARVAQIPGVAVAEGRRRISVKVWIGPEESQDLLLTAVPDFTTMQLDKVIPLSGAAAPGRQEAVVEQLSLDFIGLPPTCCATPHTIDIELEDGSRKTLTVVGTVHDANVPNARITNRAFGYITPETVAALGLGDFYTELRYRVANNPTDLAHIHAVTAAIEDQIERTGRTVFSIDTPTPGEHWAQEVIETLVLLFILFGGLIMLLSGFLVINTISALMAQQIKQIGVMKLVGARRRQITGMYFVMVTIYGALALLLGAPLGVLVAQRVVIFATDLLNVQIVSQAVPLSVWALQLAGGMGVPLGAALWPVLNGVLITTHQALNSLGIDASGGRQGWIERVFVQIQQWLPLQRPLIISLRNTLRKKGRLALTLATLIMGTALFIAVLTVRTSVSLTLEQFLRYHQYDVSLALARPYRVAHIEPLAAQVAGVVAVEGWLTDSVRRRYPDDTESETVSLTAVPLPTQFMSPNLEAGRWLQPDDDNALVVNTDFLDQETDLAVGDEVELLSPTGTGNGRALTWRIVGVVPTAANGPAVFANYTYYAHATRNPGQITTLKIITDQHDAAAQTTLAARLSQHLTNAGIRLSSLRTTEELRRANNYAFNIIVGFLVLMAILLAAVGSLGLTTTMSINVLERIREIGVLRAIGASDNAVRQIVLAEGIVIGLLSWVSGSLLAIPLSRWLSQQVGLALLGIPLTFQFATGWTFIWLFLVIALATIASLGPARSASRLTIREVLAYE